MTDDAERCLAAGMDAYLSKPIRWDELSRTLARVVSTRSPSPVLTDAIDEATLVRAAGGDRSLAAELIEVFLEEAPRRRAELRRGVASGEADLVRRAAHAVQEPLRLFAAHGTVALAVELETAGGRGDMAVAAEALARLETAMDALGAHLTSIRGE